jgi:hypothetical protein
MLRTLIVSALAALPALAASAHGQTDDVRTRASTQLLRHCAAAMAAEAEPPADADAQCQCFANVVIEGWTDREVTLFARVFAHYPDQTLARAELQHMIEEEGYTEADYRAVGARLDQAVDIVGDRCDGESETRTK